MIKKILIIDDSPISRKIIRKCIANDVGYEFYEAINGQDGLEKFREIIPDVVLLDLTMPVMDGREFLAKVKKEFPNVVVIVCTADIQKDSIEKVMSLGALDIIKKPPKRETVESALIKADIALKNLSLDMGKVNHTEISDEERDILQEIMNIAFGKAAADLAEFINIYIDLSVPYIGILKSADLPGYLKKEIKEYKQINIVEQKYWGKFKGDALLVFPSELSKELITILDPKRDLTYESDPIDMLERESLMEVGNILIGACVGKIAELLKDVVTYTPPRVVLEDFPLDAFCKKQLDSNSSIILLKTVFQFKKQDVNGFLFLLTSHDSINWLKKALLKFMEQY